MLVEEFQLFGRTGSHTAVTDIPYPSSRRMSHLHKSTMVYADLNKYVTLLKEIEQGLKDDVRLANETWGKIQDLFCSVTELMVPLNI